jgi:hypothetical protein
MNWQRLVSLISHDKLLKELARGNFNYVPCFIILDQYTSVHSRTWQITFRHSYTGADAKETQKSCVCCRLLHGSTHESNNGGKKERWNWLGVCFLYLQVVHPLYLLIYSTLAFLLAWPSSSSSSSSSCSLLFLFMLYSAKSP